MSRSSELIGESVIRSDAIRNDTKALPQLLIRGTRYDQVIRWIDRRGVCEGFGHG
jgi:hypothetical protein